MRHKRASDSKPETAVVRLVLSLWNKAGVLFGGSRQGRLGCEKRSGSFIFTCDRPRVAEEMIDNAAFTYNSSKGETHYNDEYPLYPQVGKIC